MLSFPLPSRPWAESVQYWTELYQGPSCPWIEGKSDPFGLRLTPDDLLRLKATESVMALVLQVCKKIFDQIEEQSVQTLASFGYSAEVAQFMYHSWHAQTESERYPALARFDVAYNWESGSVKVLELNGHAAGWIYEAVDRQAEVAHALQSTMPATPMINLMSDLVALLAQRGVSQSNPLWVVSPGGPEAEDDCFLVDALNGNGSSARLATFDQLHIGDDGSLMVDDEKMTGVVMLNSLYFRVLSMEQKEGLNFATSPLLALLTSAQVSMLDPLWVMLLENKALLALLWKEGASIVDFLLETVLLPEESGSTLLSTPCILKPCEECNAFGVEVFEEGIADRTFDQRMVAQSLVTLPKIGQRSVVTHAWFVGGCFSQPCFIAQDELVSNSSSAMVPCWLE